MREAAFDPPHLSRFKLHKSLSAFERLNLWPIPDDLGLTCHRQHVAGLKVDEQKAGFGVLHDIADGIVGVVTAKIGEDEATIIQHVHEPRLTTPVRSVGPLRHRIAVAIGAGDEQRIRAGDLFDGRSVKAVEGFSFRRDRIEASRFNSAGLNVLGAIAETLKHIDVKAIGPDLADLSGHPVAAPDLWQHAQDADIPRTPTSAPVFRLSARGSPWMGVAAIDRVLSSGVD